MVHASFDAWHVRVAKPRLSALKTFPLPGLISKYDEEFPGLPSVASKRAYLLWGFECRS